MAYVITYSNHFKITDAIFAFRKKKLFEISKIPIHKKQIEVSSCKYKVVKNFLPKNLQIAN
jgi:hypothetical protein